MISPEFLTISILCFTITFLLTFLIIKTQTIHEVHFTSDKYKLSTKNSSKTNNKGRRSCNISLACLITSFVIEEDTLIKLLISAIPVFLAGFIEDITKKVSPLLKINLLTNLCHLSSNDAQPHDQSM